MFHDQNILDPFRINIGSKFIAVARFRDIPCADIGIQIDFFIRHISIKALFDFKSVFHMVFIFCCIKIFADDSHITSLHKLFKRQKFFLKLSDGSLFRRIWIIRRTGCK